MEVKKIGFCLRCFQNCLSSCCLVLMAGISFTFFDLTSAISGGLFVNVGDAISGLLSLAFDNATFGTFGSILVGGLTSISTILIFPIHWLLIYRPGEAGMALALMLPWVLCVAISALLFAKSAKHGFLIGVWLAAGYIFWGLLIYILLTVLFTSVIGSPVAITSVNAIFSGLTDLHPVLAIILASLEGGLMGGAFGALVGALKYKPGEDETYEMKAKKKKRSKKSDDDLSSYSIDSPPAPALDLTSSSTGGKSFDPQKQKKCPVCGNIVTKDTKYCLKCNNYID